MANVNDLNFNQLSTVLTDILEQATGKKELSPTNTSEFVSVAQRALKVGYDPVINSINQMVTKTIFSIRPYERRFKGLMVDNQRFGAITRKLAIVDKPFEDDGRYEIEDGGVYSPYKVNAPKVLQLNYYGANVYEKSITRFKDQLDVAFTGPDQLNEFLTMYTQNCADMIEQAHEETARATINNFIAGKISADNGVVHLLSEYNEKTGLELDAQTVYQPENFKPFMEWVYSRIEEISLRMAERSDIYQIQVEDKPITRHTPRRNQKVYLYAPAKAEIDARVLTNEFHDNYLKLADNEAVTFWQNILSPTSISIAPTYLGTDGNLITGETVNQDNIFGIMFDEEAMGYTVMNQWTDSTLMNPKYGFITTYFHFTERYWNDFTEKAVVLLLD